MRNHSELWASRVVGVAAAILLVDAGVGVEMAGRTGLAQAPLTVSGAWVREPVPGRPTTAAYAVIENSGPADLHIVSAASDAAGTMEIHEMVRTGDMMKMAPVKGITVPANGKVELKPGGLHMMMFALKKPLTDGDTVSLTLTTDTGVSVTATARVRKGQVMP